jgi:hypothetical protein
MSSYSYRTSRPNSWVMPRPHVDSSQRRMAYGPIQSMERPGLLERLFGRH